MPSGAEFDPRSMFEGTRFGELRPRRHVEQVALNEVLAKQASVRTLLINAAEAHGAIVIVPPTLFVAPPIWIRRCNQTGSPLPNLWSRVQFESLEPFSPRMGAHSLQNPTGLAILFTPIARATLAA
jgi:hypothetical protein